MTELLVRVKQFHGYLCHDIDPRVKDWLFMNDPIQPALLLIAYLIFVYIGPKWMEKRKAMELNNILVIYNFTMMMWSAYIIYEVTQLGMFNGFMIGCQTVDYSKSPSAMRMVRTSWLYFMSKMVELLDTVFFILRKKNNQVTYLHVFHHGCLPLVWWWGVRSVPGGFGAVHGFVNCFVHVVMYFYYGVAALGPKFRKYLWWKKYVTMLQLSQFLIVTLHNSQYLFMECAYPWKYVAVIQGFTTIIAIMFINFYFKTYKLNRGSATKVNGAKKSDDMISSVVANDYSNEKVSNIYRHVEKRDLHHRKMQE